MLLQRTAVVLLCFPLWLTWHPCARKKCKRRCCEKQHKSTRQIQVKTAIRSKVHHLWCGQASRVSFVVAWSSGAQMTGDVSARGRCQSVKTNNCERKQAYVAKRWDMEVFKRQHDGCTWGILAGLLQQGVRLCFISPCKKRHASEVGIYVGWWIQRSISSNKGPKMKNLGTSANWSKKCLWKRTTSSCAVLGIKINYCELKGVDLISIFRTKMQWFLSNAQGARRCVASGMKYEDSNVEEEEARLSRSRTLMTPATPNLPPMLIGWNSDSCFPWGLGSRPHWPSMCQRFQHSPRTYVGRLLKHVRYEFLPFQ